MNKKNLSHLFFSLVCFSLAPHFCHALPKDPKVASGKAKIESIDSQTMEIRVSDQAIINYSKFDIGKKEKVRFIQDSSSSCVLNRVKSQDPSQILGSLKSNGKVFLVNPKGIYFGPDSKVNVGSLIASTLNIEDGDFLKENYSFTLNKDKLSSIRNEGSLIAQEGSIVLMAPQIHNTGLIDAKAGSVLLASGEHITLDFMGDGLLQFSVEGSLKEALIEHLGEIKGSTVSMKLPVAKKAISEIVNMDGAEVGEVFIEENGIIKLSSSSTLQSSKVLIEGANLEIEGNIDASSSTQKGGEVRLFGKEIALLGAGINASGKEGGGEVLIGGEYQGKRTTPYASIVTVDETSQISVNALEKGDGGLVVLWSQDRTVFDGYIEAKGGALEGKGGMVETSSRYRLNVSKGIVNTSTSQGTYGSWLLDPYTLTIVPSGGGSCPTPACGNASNVFCTEEVSNLNDALSNIVLQADTINLNAAVSLQPGIGITFTPCSGSAVTNITGSITTNNGYVTFNSGMQLALGADIVITTAGSDVTFGSIVNGSHSLTIDVGTGDVSFVGAVGGSTPLTKLSFTSVNLISIGSNISVTGANPIVFPSPVRLTGSSTSTILSNNANISFNGTLNGIQYGTQSLSLLAGTGDVVLVSLGDAIPFQNISVTGETITVSSSITATDLISMTGNATTGTAISISDEIIFNEGSCFFSSNGGDIIFPNILGSGPLTVNAGLGNIVSGSFGSDVQPLGVSTLTGETITVSGSVTTNNGMTVTASATSGTAISVSDMMTLNGVETSQFISNDGDILLSNISGSQSLTVNAGSGAVSVGALGDSTTNIGKVTLQGDTITIGGAVTTNNIMTVTAAATSGAAVSASGSITLNGAWLSTFSSSGGNILLSTVLGGQSLTVNAASGSVSVGSMGDSTTNIGKVTLTGGTITIDGAVITNNIMTSTAAATSGTAISSTGAITLNGAWTSSFISSGGNILLSIVLGSQSLTVNAGSGDISTGSLGASTSIGIITLTGETITIGGDVTTNSPMLVTAGSSIDVTGTMTLNGSGTSVFTGGPIALSAISGAQSLSLTGSMIDLDGTVSMSGALSIANSGVLTIALGSITSGSFNQTGGGDVHLGNNITTTTGTLSFADEITLTSSPTLTSFGKLTLLDTVLGSGSETLHLNSSNLVSAALLGTSTSPLGTLVISAPTDSSSFLGAAVTGRIDIAAPLQLITSPTVIEIVGAGSSSNFFRFQSNVNATSPGAQALEIDAGNNYVTFLSHVGNLVPLGDVTIDASSLYLSYVRTYGGSIDVTATTYLNATSVTLDTSSLSGGDIDFTGAVLASASPQSLTLLAGTNGVITFSDDIGPIEALTISSGSDVHIKNVTVNSNIAITPHETLSINGETSFVSTSGGSIVLGSIDGTTNGAQSLSVETTGAVGLGTIGESVFLGTVEVLTGTSASIESIFTDGEITITPPITLASSSILNSTDSDITLASVDGTVAGQESLSIIAGAGDVTLTGDVGALIPPGSLSMQAALIHLEGSKVYGAGTHTYQGPVLVDQTIGFRSLGNITFESTVDTSSSSASNLGLFLGSGDLTFMGSVGDAPFGIVAVYNAGSFSAQDILASDLIVGGGLPVIYLNGSITLSGPGGIILDGGPIHLGGEIEASRIWFRSRGDISNLGSPQSLTLAGDSPGQFEYLNAITGVIGSSASPIDLNISKTLLLGAFPSADFTGDSDLLSFKSIPFNRPCIVTYNGVTIFSTSNCLTPVTTQNIFNSLPKNLFYVPGIYSSWSWDNLSNPWYFSGEAFALGGNPRNRRLFYRNIELSLANPLAEHSVLNFKNSMPHQENSKIDIIKVFSEKESLNLPVENRLFDSSNDSKEKLFDFKMDEFPFIYMTSETIIQPYFRKEPTQEDLDCKFSIEVEEEIPFLKLPLK